jgi:small subunit ribosomal protein S9
MPKKINKQNKEIKETKYFEAVGKRKTAVARIRIFVPENKKKEKEEELFLINEKPLKEYFPVFELQETTLSPLKEVDCLNLFKISAKVRGGGFSSQADAIRHGITRALVLFNVNFRQKLKKAGFLTRDSRIRERKKFGLKRARRAPQWQKR